jgi:hypothetical protein
MGENGLGLLSRHSGKPFNEFAKARAALKVFKERFDRHARTPKHPCAADFFRRTFYPVALAPIDHIFILHRANVSDKFVYGYAEFMSEVPGHECGGTDRLGVILVDHGSRRGESNDMLLAAVRQFAGATGWPIVEPAHMELAEPSIATAFAQCVERGAAMVVVFPYFLSPGRHWSEDIPRLAAEAARNHPGIRYLVTAPFGLHPLMAQVIRERISHCLAHAEGQADTCELCAGTDRCQLRQS